MALRSSVPLGVELGYAEIAADVAVTGVAFVDIAGLSVVAAVAQRPVWAEVDAMLGSSAANVLAYLRILEDGVEIVRGGVFGGSSTVAAPCKRGRRRAPAAGPHTYKVQAAGSAAGVTATIFAAAYGGASLRVVQL